MVSGYAQQTNTWQIINPGWTKINDIKFDNQGNLYVTTTAGLYRSENNGDFWNLIGGDYLNYGDIARDDSALIASNINGILNITTDGGKTWTTDTLNKINIFKIAPNHDWYVTFNRSLIRSDNGGKTWTKLPLEDTFDHLVIDSKNRIYTFSGPRLYYSDDNGAVWDTLDIPKTTGNSQFDRVYQAYPIVDSTIVVNSGGLGIYTINGTTPQFKNIGLSGTVVQQMVALKNGLIIAQTTKDTAYYTKDLGQNWKFMHMPDAYISSLTEGSDGSLYMGTQNRGVFERPAGSNTWMPKSQNLPGPNITDFIQGPQDTLYTYIENDGVYKQLKTGNWVPFGLPYNEMTNPYQPISMIMTDKGTLLAVTKYNLYRRSASDKSWENIKMPATIFTNPMLKNISGFGIYLASGDGSYLSTDDGLNWKQINNGGSIPMAASGGKLYTIWGGINLAVSPDSGRSWTTYNYRPQHFMFSSLSSGPGDTLFACGTGTSTLYSGGSVYKVTGADSSDWHLSLYKDQGNFNASFGSVKNGGNGIYYTHNEKGEIFKYDSHTGKWSEMQSPDITQKLNYNNGYNDVNIFFLNNQNHLVEGFQLNHASAFSIASSFIYRSSLPVSDLQPLAIKKMPEVPTKFTLGQNYPNPFNPTTVIPFSLENASNVRLTVYNILGQKVETLVNQRMSAGKHLITFYADHLASGMYIYRLKANGRAISHKMLLLK